jgi:predicted O-methyltransferase YrrM
MLISDMKQSEKIRLVAGTFAKNCLSPRFWRFMMAGAAWSSHQWQNERWTELLKKSSVETVPLTSLVKNAWEATMRLPLSRGEWDTPYQDLVVLGALVRQKGAQKLFEFGTYKGMGTMTLIANAPETARIVTLDAASYDNRGEDGLPTGRMFERSEFADRVTQVIQNSTELDTAPYRQSMDFIFIDAGHDYEMVNNDTAKAFEMLAPGGVIAWHDYPYVAGVRQSIDELAEKKRIVHVEGTRLAVYFDPAP